MKPLERRSMATILIVDDEPVVLDVFRCFLEGDGRRLLLAGSAREAIAVGEAEKELDVALIDKNLGDGSGLDVARTLRRAKPDLEVILVTGYASLDSAIQAMQVGAFDYVTKPVSDYEALNIKIENALEKVRMRRRQSDLVGRLVESEELHRGVFETSSDAILLVHGETGAIEDANPAAERLYARQRGALRRMHYADVVDLEADSSIPSAGVRALLSRHRREDGSGFPVEISAAELSLREHALRVLSIRDVSEREAAETARRELEQNLRHAQKMEAVGRLAGGVAHDFSNLLAVILGYSDLLVAELPQGAARLRECADGIVEAAHRAVGVTRQLLTLSRKKVLQVEILSLNKVVQDLGKLLSRAIGERVQLKARLADGIWPVLADADQLAQVLLNLAVNARDAMPEGGRLSIATSNVELTAHSRDLGLPAGRYVALEVDDRGCGMTEEVRARVFEPFFTTKEGGTGLGLATVYGIVKQAGGAIRVDSAACEGCTMTVLLPAADERAQRMPLAVAASAPRGLGETIVLAEDEDALRTLLGRVLARSGYRVIAGRDGAEALDAVRAGGERVDVLLTDVVMPRMSGDVLAEKLVHEQPDVKVLFMTGYTEDAALLGRFARGGLETIRKPFTNEALLGHLRRLIGPAKATA